MLPKSETWYKEIWSLDIENQSWTEETEKQVDFLIQALNLTGRERVLDLACGFGRHSLELARRGFDAVGVDITDAYIKHASALAEKEKLSAAFYCMDIRKVTFDNEFDVVLSMADGAIGYLENEAENLKIFDVISRALRPGGKHFMDIMSADYANTHFPCNLWDAGEKGLTLSKFEWDCESKIMLYGQNDFAYGDPLAAPCFEKGDPIRLYYRDEIRRIMAQRSMNVTAIYGGFSDAAAGDNDIQMVVCSEKAIK